MSLEGTLFHRGNPGAGGLSLVPPSKEGGLSEPTCSCFTQLYRALVFTWTKPLWSFPEEGLGPGFGPLSHSVAEKQ